MGEDACQAYTGEALSALSILRKGIRALSMGAALRPSKPRAQGCSNMADALRYRRAIGDAA